MSPSKKSAAAKVKPEDVAGRELTVTRVIDAPRERVFEAVADPEQVAKWWGPRGFSTTTDKREFKPGGTWKHVMIGPDGAKYPNSAKFVEIVRPEKIVYVNGGAKEGTEDAVSMRSTWTFKDLGNGKTEVTIHNLFQTKEMRDTAANVYKAVEGGRQTLTRLAEHLAGEFVITRLLDAPRDLVWKAWTEPERMAKWFGPKGVTPAAATRMELRPGGVYHYGMGLPDGKTMWGKWVFREVVRPERLVFVSSFSDEKQGIARHPMAPDWPLETLSTILFDDMGGKTLLTVKWVPINESAAERKAFDAGRPGMMGGWSGTFEQLTAYLAEQTKGGK